MQAVRVPTGDIAAYELLGQELTRRRKAEAITSARLARAAAFASWLAQELRRRGVPDGPSAGRQHMYRARWLTHHGFGDRYDWLHGCGLPDARTLPRLAAALQVPLEELNRVTGKRCPA